MNIRDDYTCTLTADGWQLYSDKRGAASVAADLSGTLTVKVREAAAKLQAEPDLSEHKLASRVRDEMYTVMGAVDDWGAMDTEPQCALVAELERAFGLDAYSLDR